jgi:hypothetical protein
MERPIAPATVVASRLAFTGGHVTVQLRGFGLPGQRPLLGTIVCSHGEADYLIRTLTAAHEAAAQETTKEQ